MNTIFNTLTGCIAALALFTSDASAQNHNRSDWSVGVNLGSPVNTFALEGCPIESPDGSTLFFASNRAGGKGGIDIWVAFRDGPNDSWSVPQNLEEVNSAFDDFCPTPLPGGELLFVSRRPNGRAPDRTDTDIYFTRLHPNQGWLEPESLGDGVNSSGDELAPSYVAAGGGMIFFSSNRDGTHKIYVSQRLPHGSFDSPTAVAELNLAGSNTARPNVSQDGREIVFDSDRVGGMGGFDIWTATRNSVFDTWSQPVNLGPNVNSAFPETRPSLSRNGSRLYFGSSKIGGAGSSDLYVSSRTK